MGGGFSSDQMAPKRDAKAKEAKAEVVSAPVMPDPQFPAAGEPVQPKKRGRKPAETPVVEKEEGEAPPTKRQRKEARTLTTADAEVIIGLGATLDSALGVLNAAIRRGDCTTADPSVAISIGAIKAIQAELTRK